jgi:xanthine dehydrogenase large subunit
MTGKRHPYAADWKIGAKSDGTLVAYDVRHYQNSGAHCDLSLAVLERTLFHATNAYMVPHVRAFGVACRTHLPPNTAFRGFGGPQGMFAMECALTEVAEALGMDRAELQRKNLIEDGYRFHYGQTAERARAHQTWNQCVENHEIAALREECDRFNATNVDKKRGFAMMPICFGIAFTATFLNQASALVHVYTDGSVSVSTGGVEMGQGITTKLRAIAAQTFGVRASRVRIESTNTTRIANMSPSAASATTDLNGGATILAANQITAQLFELVATELDADPKDLSIVDEQLCHSGEPTDWDWERLVKHAYFCRVALSAHAFYATPGVWFDRDAESGEPFAYHVYGTAAVTATIDCLRGRYQIDSVRLVHDLGRPVNPLVDIGQIEGGLAQGLGWMTLEELRYSEEGQLLSHALSTYKAPDADFMPDDLRVELVEDDNPAGPYGSKAVGEPPLMYGIGAYFALRDAIKAYRKDAGFIHDAPMTPERVLLELHANEE